MHTPLVMTLLAPDQTGIVEAVSAAVRAAGGNWLESRLARLSGCFAGIVHISLPSDKVDAFREALHALETSRGLQFLLGETESTPLSGEVATLEVVGQDRPGIVHAVSDVLAEFQVNVESLDSSRSSAPMSGETLFHAVFRVRLPEGLELESVEQRLGCLGDELMLDVRFEG